MNSEGRVPLHIRCTDEAKKFLLKKGISPRYGARKLNDIVEKHVLFQLIRADNLGAFTPEDFVEFDLEMKPTPHLQLYVNKIAKAPK